MNTRLVNSAAGVINAALTQNRTAAGIALALESAQLLQSPETGEQRDRRRVRLIAAETDLLEMRGLLSPNGFPRRIPAEVEIHERVAPAVEWLLNRVAELEQLLAAKDRPVDEDPIAFALTDKAVTEEDVSPQVRKLRALLAGQQAQAGGES